MHTQIDARRHDAADERLVDIAAHATASRIVAARRTFHRDGEATGELAFVQAGWAFRFKLLPDGRRQILSIALPGNPIALHALWTGRPSCSAQSLTEVTLRLVDRRKLVERMHSDAAFAVSLGEAVARELATMEDRLVNLGQRTAIERVARLILGLHARLKRRNLADGDNFFFPLRQQHIADALGMTPVHVSRVFGELRAMNVVKRLGDTIVIIDRARLLDAAGP